MCVLLQMICWIVVFWTLMMSVLNLWTSSAPRLAKNCKRLESILTTIWLVIPVQLPNSLL
ncbi:ORF967 [White spot syndrome virus]|uniref:ORF967 n=1 Tax=White spot syndrome virus TaxID=342409 RepID=A0A2D3I7A3_9VIRU|nr:ORF967 [White spot syndrome virus]